MSIYFTIGRMNPVTPGHIRVIEQMIAAADKAGVEKVYVILSNNTKPPKNPLPCEVKAEYLRKIVSRFGDRVDIRCVPPGIHFVYQPLETLVEELGQDQYDFVMFAGEDRDEMANKLHEIKPLIPYIRSVTMNRLSRTGQTEVYTEGVYPPPEQMSASFIRDFVASTKNEPREKRYEIFCRFYEGYLNEMDCMTLLDLLDREHEPKPKPVSRKKTETKTKSKTKPAKLKSKPTKSKSRTKSSAKGVSTDQPVPDVALYKMMHGKTRRRKY